MLTTHNVPYALQRIRHILPRHKAGANAGSCTAALPFRRPHFLDDADLLHKKAGAGAGQSGPRSGDREVLTRAAPADDVHGDQKFSTQPGDIPLVGHAGEPAFGDFHGEWLDLAGPNRLDTISGRRQREPSDAVKQAPHCQSRQDHRITAWAIVRVVLTAAWAV